MSFGIDTGMGVEGVPPPSRKVRRRDVPLASLRDAI